jgi:uncharacterized Zn finger protein (UPF0148 family)
MERDERCPKCESPTILSELDGDHSCWMCGYVIYNIRPMTPEEARRDRIKAFQPVPAHHEC